MSGVLIISAVAPYPADNGKKIVVSGMLEYLKNRYGSDNVTYLFLGNTLPSDKYNTKYALLDLPKSLCKVFNVIKYSVILRNKSIQESILYSKGLELQINKYIYKMNPDLVIYDTVRIGQFGYPVGFNNRTILYMEDLFSVRYAQMLQNNIKNNGQPINALGNFAQHVPPALRNILTCFSFLEQMLLRFEKTLVWKSETKMPQKFNTSLLLNEDEVGLLSKNTSACIELMRPNINLPDPISERNYDGNSTYVFLGVLNLPYNETGLINFIETSFPILISKSPASRLRVIGRNPTQRIIDAVKKYPDNIVLEGFVENLTEALSSCCAMIVPLLYGSGIKIKVLEALAHGVPMVTTSTGAMSIPLVHNFNCFIEDDLARFPLWLVELQDIKKNKVISDNAFLLFKTHFGSDAINNSYENLFFY